MRRIHIPICTCCERSNAEYESVRWPSVKLCYICTRELSQFIVETIGVVDGNPILLELVRGLHEHRVWDQRVEHMFWAGKVGSAFSQVWVKDFPGVQNGPTNSA